MPRVEEVEVAAAARGGAAGGDRPLPGAAAVGRPVDLHVAERRAAGWDDTADHIGRADPAVCPVDELDLRDARDRVADRAHVRWHARPPAPAAVRREPEAQPVHRPAEAGRRQPGFDDRAPVRGALDLLPLLRPAYRLTRPGSGPVCLRRAAAERGEQARADPSGDERSQDIGGAPAPGAPPRLLDQRLELIRLRRPPRCLDGHDGSTIASTMIGVKIDRGEPTELHEQVAAEIRRAIAEGEAKPGERLPPARDLAAVLGVNTNTVLRALRVLRDEGLLEFRRGRGITVAGTPERGAVVAQARELVRFARTQGYRLDELVQIVESVG